MLFRSGAMRHINIAGKSIALIDETYNASPEAMIAALENLKNVPGQRKIAIIGDMVRSEERRVGKECRSRWSPYH